MKDVMLQMAKILLLGLFVILVWGIFHGSRRRVDFAVLRSEVQEVFGTSGSPSTLSLAIHFPVSMASLTASVIFTLYHLLFWLRKRLNSI